VREAESDDLRRAVTGQHVVVSDLAITEVTSALHRLGREGVLTHADVVVVLAAMQRGINAAEMFTITPVTQYLARQMFALDVPLRTLDALHLAAAVQSNCQMLVTFDYRLRDAALAIGLSAGCP
jgi:predicted nucleic acid-binding protein